MEYECNSNYLNKQKELFKIIKLKIINIINIFLLRVIFYSKISDDIYPLKSIKYYIYLLMGWLKNSI